MTRRLGVPLFALAVAGVVLGPMLRPGFPLRFDLVSVPEPALGRDAWGLGDGLPRAVPLDAVTALLARVLPDAWLTQLIALAALGLAGAGAARLVAGGSAGPTDPARSAGLPGELLAAFVAVWNPFVTEQLAIGHVPHLVAYGALPWVGLCSYRVGQTPSVTAWARATLVVAVGSITPGGGALCLLGCLAGLIAGGRWSRWGLATALTGVALQLPWVLAGIGATRSGQAGEAAGADAFALRSETGWGRIVDALGQGGMWNASALPESRFTGLARVSTVLFVVLGLTGLATVRRAGVPGRIFAAGAAVVGLTFLVAVLPVLPGGAGALTWAEDVVPGAGLLRDGHRWLAPLAIGTAVLSGFSLLGLPRGPATSYRAAAALFAGLVVVASLPDLGLGLAGRLRTWTYAPDYAGAARELDRAGAASCVLILPWSAFRDFGWTDHRTVLDPLPRMLAAPTVVTRALRVSGTLLPQEGRQARAVDAALADSRLSEAELRSAGIGWVVVERGTSGRLPELPRTLSRVSTGPGLTLYRLPRPAAAPAPGSARTALAATGFTSYFGSMVAAAMALALVTVRRILGTRSRDR